MPTISVPADSNVTLDQRAASFLAGPFSSHIYLALGTLVVLAVVRSATARFWPRRLDFTRIHEAEENYKGWQEGHYPKNLYGVPESSVGVLHGNPALAWPLARLEGPGPGSQPKQVAWATHLLAGNAVVQTESSSGPVHPQSPDMDGHGSRKKREDGTLPSRSSHGSSLRQHSSSSRPDVVDGHRHKGKGKSESKGKGPVDDNNSISSSSGVKAQDLVFNEDAVKLQRSEDSGAEPAAYAGTWEGNHMTAMHFSRPPPPPPLTPPTLSSWVSAFEDRRLNDAVSVPPELDSPTYITRAKPGTTASSSSADTRILGSPRGFPGAMQPRRRSYTRTMPVAIHMPGLVPGEETADTFSPSSYPPTSPLLPPPPPGHYDDPRAFAYEPDFLGHALDSSGFPIQQEIDVHGEIITLMDDAHHGWKRHTRVYGGGVCLACAAAGGQGGFYGDTVPPEHKRQHPGR